MKIIEQKQLKVDDELLSICNKIHAEGKSDEEWAEIESCDMFQSPKYCGGYDATEQGFWFSYYDQNKKEWWFEITTESLNKIIKGELQYLDLYEPNN
ncbi:MAG: hypothetical protein JW927_14645 [Deltaproteobacteria bacterium]|nr:hypothetical protein [Deltaproteobacteria bacterium]